ncbi:MAG: beta-propeller domain-containing protein, partial [Oscillospiraceae bacterium]|nr:beta-propeller domain-containing protein [Oscillospiraceae bacterium]
MKLKKIKFFKLFSFVIISSLFLSITAYSTVAVSSKEQRLKSYDELKQIYMKILGTESTTRDPYLYTMNEDVVVAAPEFAPAPAEAPQASMAMNTTSSASAVSVSSTNTQVAGVDEGDIVKTDGNYIYAVSNINGNK